MLADAITWAWDRFRPEEGWLSFFLLLVTAACLVASVLAVGWVPEDDVVAVAALGGLLLGATLAKRPLHPLPAWGLLLAYGLVITAATVGQLLPPLFVFLRGEGAEHFRRQWAVLVDRAGGWLLAVSSGGSSQETIVFAFLLGLAAWLLVAYAAWSSYRQRRPLVGLSLLGLALAANSHFGVAAPVWPLALFVGATTLLTAAMHFANMENRWATAGIDYSTEIRIELVATAGGVALVLITIAFILPTLRPSAIAEAFQRLTAVQETEETLERIFGGVREPRGNAPAYGPGGSGVLPRSFLLGNAPELYETVMMTATLRPAGSQATHWRAASYDVYTGRGWAISLERQEPLPAGAPIPLPSLQNQTPFSQTVHWVFDERPIRYTIGLPLTFAEDVTVFWRGVNDFSRAQSERPPEARTTYAATSRLATANPATLRQSTLDAVPDVIAARYTELPEDIPGRVHELAQEIAAGHATPYDQAKALETFLRQYPYTLDVALPPPGRDPVDYFLFDLQEGYCDYYASAMAVLARSLGLPARLATGFLAQPPDAAGVQTVYQINAHAWTEVYFAGVGWVEFEPTAAFSPVDATPPPFPEAAGTTPEPAATPPPIPDADEDGLSPWWALLPAGALVVLVVTGWWWWRRPRPAGDDEVLWAFGRLQRAARRLGHPLAPSQTPAEFAAIFLDQMARWEGHPRLARWLDGARPGVERLVALFMAQQYGREKAGPDARREARTLWRWLARRLWLVRVWRMLPGGKEVGSRE